MKNYFNIFEHHETPEIAGVSFSEMLVINTLTDQFTDYYRHHHDKTIIYYRDRYGDSKNPNVNKSASYNDILISMNNTQVIQKEGNSRKTKSRNNPELL